MKPTLRGTFRAYAFSTVATAAAVLLRWLLNPILGGNDTRVVQDGVKALEAAEQFKPDAILLDIGLPGMSGYEVARRVREQPWGKRIALVAIRGWGRRKSARNHAMRVLMLTW